MECKGHPVYTILSVNQIHREQVNDFTTRITDFDFIYMRHVMMAGGGWLQVPMTDIQQPSLDPGSQTFVLL